MHTLIVGATRCGKSVLSKKLALSYLRQGIAVVVCDPHATAWPDGCRVFTDPDVFLAYLKKCQRVAAIIDEGGEVIGRGRQARKMAWVTAGSAKYGIKTHIVCQGASMIERNIRTNCGRLFCFKQAEDDCALLVRDFAEKRIMEAANLVQYEFLDVTSCGPVRRYKLTL